MYETLIMKKRKINIHIYPNTDTTALLPVIGLFFGVATLFEGYLLSDKSLSLSTRQWSSESRVSQSMVDIRLIIGADKLDIKTYI